MEDDEKKPPEDVGPRSGKPPTERQGPLRRPPAYYAGRGKIKGRPIVHADTATKADGTYGKKNKAARRMIRAKLKKSRSSVEKGVRYAQDLRAQAHVLSNNGRDARRILEAELAQHAPVPQPPVRGDRKRTPRRVREQISEAVDKAIGVAHDVKKAGE